MEGYARDIKLFSGTANPKLAEAIARHMGMELGHVNIERFPDGEIFVQYRDMLRTSDVFIIQPTCNPVKRHGGARLGHCRERPLQRLRQQLELRAARGALRGQRHD